MSDTIRQHATRVWHRLLSRRRVSLAAVAGAAVLVSLRPSPALAESCQFIGGPQFGGIEAPMAEDADCTDPDYNEQTFVLDSTQQQMFTLPDGSTIPYTEVKGHFAAMKT